MPRSRLCVLALLVAGSLISVPAAAQEPAGDGELRETLRALAEELRLLRHEMSALRKEMRAAGQRVRAPSAAAPPPAPVTLALLEEERTLGSEQATVAVIEYSDFEGPYCNRFHQQTLPRLKAEYIDTGKVRYLFRDFPLSFHKKARPAHIAAHCAGEQGKFWEMHRAMFLNQKRLGPELFDEKMNALGLDATAFGECLRDPGSTRRLDAAIRSGDALNVRGTPTFFIGRLRDGKVEDAVRISGAQPFGRFAGPIETLLQ